MGGLSEDDVCTCFYRLGLLNLSLLGPRVVKPSNVLRGVINLDRDRVATEFSANRVTQGHSTSSELAMCTEESEDIFVRLSTAVA